MVLIDFEYLGNFMKDKIHAIYIKLISNVRFRTMFLMIPGLVVNALYMVINIVIGIKNDATWFIYLGVYCFYLVLMKGYLLYYLAANNKVQRKKEYRIYRNCGITLLFLNFVLIGESVYIVHKNQNYHYQGVLIYAMAAFAFYNLTMAIINIVRFQKFKSPVLSAVKAINLTTAMVTMLALETAMISQFGDAGQGDFRAMITRVTAFLVCLVEFVIAVHMICDGNKNTASFC